MAGGHGQILSADLEAHVRGIFARAVPFPGGPTRPQTRSARLDGVGLRDCGAVVSRDVFVNVPAHARVNPSRPVVSMETGRDVDFYVRIGCTDKGGTNP